MVLNLLERVLDGYFSCIPREIPSRKALESARLIAHRGAHNHAQRIIENTLHAFKLAHHLGCWGIELDIRETADKILIVHHDSNLKRLWRYNINISNLKFEELRGLVPEIPTLHEVISSLGKKIHLFIELKTPFVPERTLAANLRGLSPVEDYHLLSLNADFFSSLSQFPKESLLLIAGLSNLKEFYNISIKENYGGVLGHYFLVTDYFINHLKSNHKVVGVGQVDSKFSLYRELNRGINWIFTDRAAEIHPYLKIT